MRAEAAGRHNQPQLVEVPRVSCCEYVFALAALTLVGVGLGIWFGKPLQRHRAIGLFAGAGAAAVLTASLIFYRYCCQPRGLPVPSGQPAWMPRYWQYARVDPNLAVHNPSYVATAILERLSLPDLLLSTHYKEESQERLRCAEETAHTLIPVLTVEEARQVGKSLSEAPQGLNLGKTLQGDLPQHTALRLALLATLPDRDRSMTGDLQNQDRIFSVFAAISTEQEFGMAWAILADPAYKHKAGPFQMHCISNGFLQSPLCEKRTKAVTATKLVRRAKGAQAFKELTYGAELTPTPAPPDRLS